MARENVGLRVALIISAFLIVILILTTYLFFHYYDEEVKNAIKVQERADEMQTANDNIQEENNNLKKLMGCKPEQPFAEILDQFNKDMETYAGTYPEEARNYHDVLPYLDDAVKDKLAELKSNKEEIQSLKDKYEVREASKDPQIKEFEVAAMEADRDKKTLKSKYDAWQTQYEQGQAKVLADLKKLQKASDVEIAKRDAEIERISIEHQKAAQLNRQKSAKLQSLVKETFEVPDGEIRWVNQGNGTVWINLGRADALQRQTTFSVYPADTTNLTTMGKKASIEVTQILGAHTAEARILEDQISDPIMLGDKIHTPVWSPGEQKRFALAGFMELDGDGKSDQHIVRNLITMNGGVVDCETDEEGNRHGVMSAETSYIVLGRAPDEKSKPSVYNGYSRMIREAEKFGVKKISLAELLKKMGWKNQSPVVRFGKGANPADFRAKPAAGVPRASTGNVSDVFKHRRPPIRTRTGPGSAY